MIGAHIVDNRPGICSLAFQAFVWLGVGDYSSGMGKYLSQKSSYEPNDINNAPLKTLLEYNGKDALLTYLIAKKQREYLKFNYPFL
jgi:hypothetical protein